MSLHVFMNFFTNQIVSTKKLDNPNIAKKDADRKIRQNSFFRKSYWKQVVTYKSIFPGRIWKPLSIRGSFLASLNEHWVLILSPSIIWQKNSQKNAWPTWNFWTSDWNCGLRPELNFFCFCFDRSISVFS